MIVCSCNVLSDHDVRSCLAPGPDCPFTPAQVYRCLGCSPQCGRCARTIRQIMDEALPGVHGACTSRCSVRCPLSPADGTVGDAVERDILIKVGGSGATTDIRESVEIREVVRA